jgi:tetratricopeptide (TPR) repeat protein
VDTNSDQAKGIATLRGSISVLTRGGPFTVNVLQDTNPVLLKGMRLPAEAEYVFTNPIVHEHNYVNKPVTAELFFGENGREGEDVSLGVYPIFALPTVHATGPKDFEIVLAVSTAQVLSILVLDHATQHYRGIGYMDLSGLEPPQAVPKPNMPFAGFTMESLQAYVDSLMKAPPRKARLPQGGKDLSEELTVSFEDALHGSAKTLQVASTLPCPVCTGSGVRPGEAMLPCPACEGTGMKREEHKTEKGPEYRVSSCPHCHGDGLINAFPCKECKGNGWVRATRPITLQIPACIDSGAEICLLHQGEPGRDGGPAGHLRISVHVAPHPLFSRTGRELSVVIPVSADFARLGGRVRVPGPEQGSTFMVDLPASTQDNSLLRVFDGDDYSLTARIETYRPGFLSPSASVRRRLQEIQDRLAGPQLEVPGRPPGGQGRSGSEMAFASRASGRARPKQLADFYVRRGTLYANKRDRAHAMADFDKALELDPACAAAYDLRAAEHGFHKDLSRALADIEKAVELDPRNAAYLLHKGMIHELQNDPDKARAAYDTALDIDPACLDAYDRRGRLAVARGDLRAAVADFTRVLAAKPDNDEVRGNRSLVYASLKEFDKAIADLDRFVERHPMNSNGYNNRGSVHLQKNDLQKALGDYDRALELNPRLVPARIYRGKTLLLLGQFKKAIEDLEQALTLDPREQYPLLLLGQAYQGMGEKKQAVAAYQRYLDSSQSPELCREARMHLQELGIKAA